MHFKVDVRLHENISQGAIDGVKDQFAPLMFGAAWKVLDLMLELALNCAGLNPSAEHWSINQKQKHAANSAGDRSVLTSSSLVWNAVSKLYAATVEHRHCLVHRTANVDPTTGTLEGVDRQGRAIRPLTRIEQEAIAKLAGLVARGVIAGGLDSRHEDHLKYLLDQVIAHTQVTSFNVGGVSAPAEIVLTLKPEGDGLVLDMSGVLERARRVFPTVAHFNLLIDVPGQIGRRLFARAEDVPVGISNIDITALPPWADVR